MLVRSNEKDVAKAMDVAQPLTIEITDPYGNRIHGPFSVNSSSALQSGLAAAMDAYKDAEPAWQSSVDSIVEQKKSSSKYPSDQLVVCLFSSGSDESKDCKKAIDALSDKALTGFRSKVTFVRENFEKDSELCAKYNITKDGTILIIQPGNAKRDAQVLKRYASPPSGKSLADALNRYFSKIRADIAELKAKETKDTGKS